MKSVSPEVAHGEMFHRSPPNVFGGEVQLHAVDGWELADGESAGEEQDYEEAPEMRRFMKVVDPTKEQRVAHELENHAVYRPWCKVCVAGRGVGSKHRLNRAKQFEETKDGPCIFSDYFFMSTDEGSDVFLAMKFSRSGRLAATSLPVKGASEFGVKYFRNFVQSTGVTRFINFSDNENAMVALKEAGARAATGVEAVSRSIPVGDHQSNGHIENAVKQIKGQMRSIRYSLESKLGCKLSNNDDLLKWIPHFAADIISKFRRGRDGKTAYEKELGRKWSRQALEFGEKIMLRIAEEVPGRPKRDWKQRLVEARFIGYHSRSNSIMGLTAEGVKFGSSANRVPWDLEPDAERRPQVAVEREAPRLAPPAPEVADSRSFYVQKRDIEKFGSTPTCPGCAAISRGARRSVAHSTACRGRIFYLVEEDEQDRAARFFERVRQHEARRSQGVQVSAQPSVADGDVPAQGVEIEGPVVFTDEEPDVGKLKREGGGDESPSKRSRKSVALGKKRTSEGEHPEEVLRGSVFF